jgi:hypothetical protein
MRLLFNYLSQNTTYLSKTLQKSKPAGWLHNLGLHIVLF